MNLQSTVLVRASQRKSYLDHGMGKSILKLIDILYSTAKIWDVETGKVKQTLEGHSHAVSVLTLENGIIITGS